MPLVPLLTDGEAPLTARAHYARGDPGPIVSSLAHVPEALEVALPFIGTVLGASSIDARTKEIVILRTSALLRCRYCTETHTVVARDSGLSRDECAALRDEQPVSTTFTDARELALIAWADAVALGPAPPAASVADALAGCFSEAEIVELTLLAGTTLMLNRYATALGLPTGRGTLERLAADGW